MIGARAMLAAMLIAAAVVPGTARPAVPLGGDSAACVSGRGPAIEANITGLKERTGRLKLELYPANEADFLKDDRDGKNRFNFWRDGACFPGNARIGRSRPKLAQAKIEVGHGVTVTTIRAQYLRGLSGFAPAVD